MSSYAIFSNYYDALTHNVDYKQRCDRLCTLLERYHATPQLVLDLACGTGSLTLELADRGFEPIGVDASPEMLAEAQQKAIQSGQQILFLCQRMQKLDLYGTIDAAFCTLDSINHMTREADVRETFRRVSLFMNPDGWFLFDVNTPYKHQRVLGDHTFVLDTEEVFCAWQNELQADHMTVQIQLDFFARRENKLYMRSSERFRERAYSAEDLTLWLQEAGFDRIDCYAENLETPQPDTERWIFAAHKPAVPNIVTEKEV